MAQQLGAGKETGSGTGTPMKAVWNGAVLAESDRIVKLEGNRYFPPESLNREHLLDSDRTSLCPWKGVASYYDIQVDGDVNEGAAWTYRKPSPLARKIKDHVAFWQGVEVIPSERAGSPRSPSN